MKRIYPFLILLFISSLPLSAAPAASQSLWQAKVDSWIINRAAASETEFLVFLTSQADLSGADRLATKEEKGKFVYKQLRETAERTQGPLLAKLEQMGLAYRPYWVANMIWVRGDASAVQEIAGRADVSRLYANPSVKAEESIEQKNLPIAEGSIEWNIYQVGAPEVWAAGFTGQGAVIGGQDTGYEWDHPALIEQYRGWDGTDADHNYNWHDAIHEDNPNSGGVNFCGFDSLVTCDDGEHGTHTMGTMLGDDGAGNQIGMAPGAKWIGCRNMENGWGKPSTYAECYQWFIAPTDLNGENPDPAKAPDVINNSWGCPPNEGCTDPAVLQSVVEAVRAAGIVTVHSAGNSGSACRSVVDPAAIYEASFTVGATNSSDGIADFSSRGPVDIDGSNRLKPNISAPGVSIRSSTPRKDYSLMSGTSMAGPHVAGLVALLISAQPALRGQVEAIETYIEQNAVHLTTDQSCGGTAGQVPNNAYGWGRIDAYQTIINPPHNFQLLSSVSSLQVSAGQSLTYTFQITHLHPVRETQNVILTDTLPANTTFLKATGPYEQQGQTIVWRFPILAPWESETVQVVVQASQTLAGPVINDNYSVSSDEVPEPVRGSPVISGGYALFLPVIQWLNMSQ